MVFDGRAAESRMVDVSGRRTVLRLGWGSIDRDASFESRVLLGRWRWFIAWQMAVYRDMYMPSDRVIEKKGIL